LGFEIGQRRLEAVMHSWGSYFVHVPKLDITTVKKGSINPEQMARHFREIEGVEEFRLMR